MFQLARSQKESYRLVCRVQMVLQVVAGYSLQMVAAYLHRSVKTVQKWLDRFSRMGPKGLLDLPRSGRPQVYSPEVRLKVVGLACQYPGKEYLPGVTHWSVRTLAQIIRQRFAEIGKISRETVRRILKAHHLQPHRIKYFLTRTDPHFFQKAEQVLKLYQSPPEDGVVICVDERTGIQALERKHPGLPMLPGHCQKQEFEYKRHGTFCLIAGLNIATGKVFGQCYERHTNVEFRDFLEKLLASFANQKLYIILDNLKTHLHSNVQELVAKHNIQLVFLPFHGSWLNQIEIWFSILNGKCIHRADWKSIAKGMDEVMKFIVTWNENWAHPFKWKFTADDLKKLLGVEEQIKLPNSASFMA
ncbi:IS630 family transposase [Desulfofundulus thermobenzoicus]|uniref:IS630 family transposase n=1 Tax=Desulfofundulus thermobenzoicus TaxID=29376 RepID=A0A6N7IUI9_9FIRM|nr:IS630 family transposase [Desulfofundulus thermobenzoicus]